MSKPLVDGSPSNVKEAFRKKIVFGALTKSEHSNLIDFNFAEKQLYGRVNREYLPIVANDRYFKFASLVSTSDRNIYAYDFVVHAFTQMQSKFKIKFQSGQISTNEEFLSDLIPFAGYVDPKGLYDTYTSTYAAAMREIANEQNIRFTNFSEFIDKMMPFIENTILGDKPFTYSSFIKDKKCPINVSGLVIEVADIDPSNDMDKYNKFYNSNNWEFFLNACQTYGFMVDANNPHRIVADIGSPTMVEYMRQFNNGVGSTDDFLALSYELVAQNYFQNFKLFFYQIYNESRRPKIVTMTENLNDGTKIEITKSIPYTFDSFQQQFNDLYFFKLYAKIRFLEEESKFTESQKNSIINEATEIAKTNVMSAVNLFERILSKTFDYSGSLSYITQRRKDLRV